jgi:hypothetical protein
MRDVDGEAIFQAVASPASQTAMARVCPPHRTAAGQGLGAVLGLAGAGLVGSVAPTLYGATSSTVVFGGVAAACAVIFFVARALYGPDGGGARRGLSILTGVAITCRPRRRALPFSPRTAAHPEHGQPT